MHVSGTWVNWFIQLGGPSYSFSDFKRNLSIGLEARVKRNGTLDSDAIMRIVHDFEGKELFP